MRASHYANPKGLHTGNAALQLLYLDIIQLHGREDDEYISRLREAFGGEIWKAFTVRSAGDLSAAQRSAADEI